MFIIFTQDPHVNYYQLHVYDSAHISLISLQP